MNKRKNISGYIKRDVWLKYVGNKVKTKCFCCRKKTIYGLSSLGNSTWQAGHIISYNNGGKNEIYNLHPICKPCNQNMSDENWDDYVDRHVSLFHSLPYLMENYYKKYEKGVRLWQSLWRHYLWTHRRFKFFNQEKLNRSSKKKVNKQKGIDTINIVNNIMAKRIDKTNNNHRQLTLNSFFESNNINSNDNIKHT